MPQHKVTIANGINQQLTQTQNSTSWWACNLIRFRDGMVERYGGWQRLFSEVAAGIIRQFHAYEDLNLVNELLIAGDGGLQIWNTSDGLTTIEIIGSTVNVAEADFVPTVGSAVVTVAEIDHELVAGNEIFLPITISIGGIVYYPASYIVQTVTSTSTYTINTPTVALTTATGKLPVITPTSSVQNAGSDNVLTAAARGNGYSLVCSSQGEVNYHDSTTFNWTQAVGPGFGVAEIAAAIYGNSVFVGATTAGVIRVSTNNGAGWFARVSGLTSANCAGFGNGVLIVAGDTGQLSTSTDALAATWVVRASAAAAFGASAINGVTYGALYVIVGAGGKIATSPDAITWTLRTSGIVEDFVSVTYGNSTYVAICASGVFVSSTDGITWSAGNIGTTGRNAIAFGNGVFVTVGIGGQVAVSADLGTWTLPASASAFGVATIYTVVYADGLFMASGQFGRNIYSVDGLTWWWPAEITLVGSGLAVGGSFSFQFDTEAGQTVTGDPTSTITFSGAYTVDYVLSADKFIIDQGELSIIATPVSENAGVEPVYYSAGSFAGQQNWSLDNLGNNALINPSGDSLYVWTPSITTPLNFALNVTTASQVNTSMLVAMPQAQVITLGSQAIIGSGDADPLLIRFSDAGGYTDWTATSTNQAGSYRLSRGSRIIGGIQISLVTLVFTDLDVWAMQYAGPPYVYSFNILSSNCGLIAQNAVGILNSTAYWMGQKQFYRVSSGGAQGIACPVWDIIFNDLDQDNISKIFCASNSSYNEIAWFYPSISGGTGECDKFVMLQTNVPNNQGWSYGTLTRTAWHDSSVIGGPVGADVNMRVQEHDVGYNDDGEPMVGAFIESGFADISDGDYIMSINEIMQDAKWFGTTPGAVSLTVKGANYPQGPTKIKGPFGMDMSNRHIRPRMRARFIALRWDWVARLDYNARIGPFRVKTQPSGRRP